MKMLFASTLIVNISFACNIERLVGEWEVVSLTFKSGDKGPGGLEDLGFSHFDYSIGKDSTIKMTSQPAGEEMDKAKITSLSCEEKIVAMVSWPAMNNLVQTVYRFQGDTLIYEIDFVNNQEQRPNSFEKAKLIKK
jgi:hypothetical protein